MALFDLATGDFITHARAATVALDNSASYAEQAKAANDARRGVVTIPFPKFTDGRGFSIANIMRRRFDYVGEIRAIGQLIPDQALLLHRAGFDTVEISTEYSLTAWRRALARYRGAYQTALRNPIALRREAAAVKFETENPPRNDTDQLEPESLSAPGFLP